MISSNSFSFQKWLRLLEAAAMAFGTLLLAGTARADLLVLQAGYSGHGPGLVSRIDLETGASRKPLLPTNESCQAMCTGVEGSVYVTANVMGYGIVYRYNSAGELLGKCADLAGTQFEAAAAGENRIYLLGATHREDGTSSRAIFRGGTHAGAQPSAFIAAGTGGMFAPVALALGRDGHLYVADLVAGVLRFDAKTGAFMGVFVPPGRGGLGDVTALAVGNDDRLYVGTAEAHAVLRFDLASGAFVDAFVTAAPGTPAGVRAIAFGPDGDLYTLAVGEHEVRRFDGRNGMNLGVVAGGAAWQRPSAIAFAGPRDEAPAPRSQGAQMGEGRAE
jgi:DNA-binding beta-propeller fold protein YncE